MALTSAEKNSTFVGLKQLLDPRLTDFEKGIVLQSFLAASHIGEVTSGSSVFTASPTGDNVPQWVELSLTNTQLLALRATPITLIAAPGAGKIIQLIEAHAFFDYTAAYTESADNIALRYTDGSGATAATIETTGFLDATADTYTRATIAAVANIAKTAADNQALVLHNNGDGEFGGGNAANVLRIRALYRILPAGW